MMPAMEKTGRLGRYLKPLLAVLWCFFAAPAIAQVTHPMDALTGKEVARAVAALKAAGRADDSTRFPVITLKEMAKQKVLAWTPGKQFSRTAFVVFRHKRRTYEATIDLNPARIVEIVEKPGAQPNIILDEWILAARLTKKNPRWRAAMKKRAIPVNDQVVCSPVSAGYLRDRSYQGKRILKVPCYQYGTQTSHLYGRAISGLYTVVDVEAGKVIEVVDTGGVTPPGEPDSKVVPRAALKTVQISSPDGKNFQLSGSIRAQWQNWSFHVRMDRRVGPIVSLVRYADQGAQRLVAYQMALSEIFVPYMDPSGDWAARTFLDAGEFGVGFQMSTLMPGADCPEQATFITTVVPNDLGKVFPVRRSICIFERATGDPAWRHGNPARPTGLTRPAIELVVRSIPTLGNYDYIIDWVFTQAGAIRVEVGATGIVATRSVASAGMAAPTAARDTANGALVAPGTVAVNHSHFFNFRLDLDVDGPANAAVRDTVVPQRLARPNPRRSLWVVDSQFIEKEGPVRPDRRGFASSVRLVNPNKTTSLGYNPGYQLVTGGQARSVLAADDDPQGRAAFSANTVWLSRFDAREKYGSGDFPNLSRGGAGLPAYVGDRATMKNEDLVLWATLGIDHFARAEDWPVMPTRRAGFTLRPFNFFTRNPAYDLPAGFAEAMLPALRSTIQDDEKRK